MLEKWVYWKMFNSKYQKIQQIDHLLYVWPCLASVKPFHSDAYDSIKPFKCHGPSCKNHNKEKEAVRVCLDPAICAEITKLPPPLYLCEQCYGGYKKKYPTTLYQEVLQPVGLVSQFCENIDCRVGFMKSVYFCFSSACIKKNGNKPMRLCEDCHSR